MTSWLTLPNPQPQHFPVRIFKEAGEEETAAYTFYNLANDLRSAYRFRAAKRYLNRARHIAEKHKIEGLLKGIRLLEMSIKARNRDTPNYAAGERRAEG
jgi:hypothetical protein